jgi:hypothetical protein
LGPAGHPRTDLSPSCNAIDIGQGQSPYEYTARVTTDKTRFRRGEFRRQPREDEGKEREAETPCGSVHHHVADSWQSNRDGENDTAVQAIKLRHAQSLPEEETK